MTYHPGLWESKLYCDRRLGGVERWVYGDPRQALMRVPDPILQSAVFLCVKGRDGQVIPAGTAFCLLIECESGPSARRYLVTARHCIEKAKPYGALYVRVHNFRGELQLIELEPKWKYHDDEANDVAVLSTDAAVTGDIMVFERASLATTEVLTKESVGIGDDLLAVGLFKPHPGSTANLPIVRAGTIAAMPREQIRDSKTGEYFDAYLAEVRSIGGLSGSPVWLMLSPNRLVNGRIEGGVRFYLLGLLRGHWQKGEDWLSDFGETEEDAVNTGIAMVTPIQKALDIVDSPPFLKARRERVQDRERSLGQVLDSAPEPTGAQVADSGIPGPEFQRFEDLTRRLTRVSKEELDEERKADKEIPEVW